MSRVDELLNQLKDVASNPKKAIQQGQGFLFYATA